MSGSSPQASMLNHWVSSRVFPRLRELCEARSVSLNEVDLRWSIIREQAEQGQVLPIFPEEIERSRP